MWSRLSIVNRKQNAPKQTKMKHSFLLLFFILNCLLICLCIAFPPNSREKIVFFFFGWLCKRNIPKLMNLHSENPREQCWLLISSFAFFLVHIFDSDSGKYSSYEHIHSFIPRLYCKTYVWSYDAIIYWNEFSQS